MAERQAPWEIPDNDEPHPVSAAQGIYPCMTLSCRCRFRDRYMRGFMKRTAKTLIVDDSMPVATVVEKLLNMRGVLDITKAGNGLQGLESFERALLNGTPYDLVFLDIVMPVMDGQEALKRMRALEAEMGITWDNRATIVMLSGLDSPDDMVKTLIQGDRTDYLGKPFHMEELGAMLVKHDFL